MTASLTGTGPAHEVAVPAPAWVLLRRRRVIAWTAVALAALVVVVELVRPRTWSSSASFVPSGRRMPSSLTGLAAQLGVNVPTADAATNPAFYADLVTSREILSAVADTSYRLRDGQAVRFADLYRVKAADSLLRRERAADKLAQLTRVSLNQKTGVVTVSVRATDPAVAQALAQRFLDLLNGFNLVRRQSQASAERRFTEGRLREVRQELRAAEDRLQAFLARNRDLRNSPELAFQRERLARDVSLAQDLFGTLSQAFEQARIEEVRDTPVITVLDRPQLAARPDSRRLALKVVAAGLFGLVLGAALAILLGAPAGEPRDIAAEGAAALADLRRPWRLLGDPRRA